MVTPSRSTDRHFLPLFSPIWKKLPCKMGLGLPLRWGIHYIMLIYFDKI
jgi:hypothetical protein